MNDEGHSSGRRWGRFPGSLGRCEARVKLSGCEGGTLKPPGQAMGQAVMGLSLGVRRWEGQQEMSTLGSMGLHSAGNGPVLSEKEATQGCLDSRKQEAGCALEVVEVGGGWDTEEVVNK